MGSENTVWSNKRKLQFKLSRGSIAIANGSANAPCPLETEQVELSSEQPHPVLPIGLAVLEVQQIPQ